MNLYQYIREFRINLKLALPVVTGMIFHITVGVFDDAMVGYLGPVHLAATSLGNSLIFVAMSLGIGFSFAITPLIAEADGEKNIKKGQLIFQHGFLMMTVLGVILVALMLLVKPVLYHLNQPPEVVELAVPYFQIVAISILPMLMFQGFKQFADGMSQTKYAMYAGMVSNIINIALNFVLIYGWWIFPKLGIVGAALGTLISRVFMLFLMYYAIRNKRIFKPYFVRVKRSEIKTAIFKKISGIGLPTSLQMLFEVGVFTAAIVLAGVLGTYTQAANQIAIKLASITFMISIGIGVAATIRVGNQKGLKDFVALRRVAISNFLLIVLIMFVFSILFVIFRDYLPLAFVQSHEIEVIKIAASLLILAGVFQISDGLQAVVLAALRGLQDVNIPTVITFIAYWIIGFPICYYLGLHTELEAFGVWIGLLISLTVSALLLLIRFNYLTKKLIKA